MSVGSSGDGFGRARWGGDDRCRREEFGDGGAEIGGADGFGEVALETGAQGAEAIFFARVRGERDGGEGATVGGGQAADAADERVAVFVGHRDVADDQVGAVARVSRCDAVERGAGAGGDVNAGAESFEQARDDLARVGLVIDDENRATVEIRRRR